jgi:hypothetical protein
MKIYSIIDYELKASILLIADDLFVSGRTAY